MTTAMLPFEAKDAEMIERERFKAKITRLRLDGDDLGSVKAWLTSGVKLSWKQFQAIDPRRDHDEFLERQERNERSKELRNEN